MIFLRITWSMNDWVMYMCRFNDITPRAGKRRGVMG